MQKVILLISVIVMSVGCASTSDMKNYQINELKDLATFDLDCPKDKLKVKVIKDTIIGFLNYQISSAGVTGCGKRIRYIRPEGKWTWIANTKSE